MLFEQVLPALRDGKTVSCKSWGDVFIYFVEKVETGGVGLCFTDALYTGLIANVDGVEYFTKIGGDALLADDWYILDEA